MPVTVVTIDTPELGDRSYLVHDGHHALVVDPQRDLDRVLDAACAAGVEITHVAETHLHNDYLSGGPELARVSGARYLVAAAEPVELERTPVEPGDAFAVGSLRVEAIATPGHTPHHLAYLVSQAGRASAVCTGGSLLYGAVGRTDLAGPERAGELAAAQHRSVRALAERLGDEVAVLPTHGFGSFCSGGAPAARGQGTMADERRDNPALSEDHERRFVSRLLAGLGGYPRYYGRMGALNRAGAGPPPPPPELVDPSELAGRLRAGALAIDLRHRRAFAGAHLAGTLSFELAQPFTTYVGWVLSQDEDLLVLCAGEEELGEAARCLGRIGREVAGGLTGGPGALASASGVGLGSFPVATFADLASLVADGARPAILDVRAAEEWAEGHIAGAAHRFVADLPDALAGGPRGAPDGLPGGRLFVHCASGYRAAAAASLLARAGRDVVLVDDEWASAAAAGLEIRAGEPGPARPW